MHRSVRSHRLPGSYTTAPPAAVAAPATMPMLVQVTDTHLRADPSVVHWGFRSQASLQTILSHVHDAHHDEVDMVLVTGDCVHSHPREADASLGVEGVGAYQILRRAVEKSVRPDTRIRALTGNHDSRQDLATVFPEVLPTQPAS